MRRVTWRARGLTLSLGVPLFLLLASANADAKVYKWVDEDGVERYTIEREENPPRARLRLRSDSARPVTPDDAVQTRYRSESQRAFGSEAPLEGESATEVEALPEAETTLEAETRGSAATGLAAVPPPSAPPPVPTPAPAGETSEQPEEQLEPDTPDDAYPELAQNTARIRELEEQIRNDREELKRLISEGKDQGLDIANDPRVREIAERLPRLEAELATLRRGDRE